MSLHQDEEGLDRVVTFCETEPSEGTPMGTTAGQVEASMHLRSRHRFAPIGRSL